MQRTLMMIVLLLALTACGGATANPTANPTAPAAGGNDLNAQILGTWNATALGGAAPIPGSTLTLTFEDGGQVAGRACNSIGGTYAVDGEGLRFSGLFQTEMACMEPAGVMEQESRFAQALASTSSARIEGTTLMLLDAAGQEVLTFTRSGTASGSAPPADPSADLAAELIGRWNVTALDGAALAPNSSITLQLEPGGQLGAQACNSIGGSYTVDMDTLSFGQLRSTMMACDPPVLMNQETRFQQALASTATAHIEGTTLQLIDAAGQEVLTLERMQ